MFLTKDSTSWSYVLVSSSQHVTEKQALAKAIGKVVVTQTQSSTFGSVLVPHCYAWPTMNTRDAPLVLDAFFTVQDDSVTPVTRLSMSPVVPVIGFTEAK